MVGPAATSTDCVLHPHSVSKMKELGDYSAFRQVVPGVVGKMSP